MNISSFLKLLRLLGNEDMVVALHELQRAAVSIRSLRTAFPLAAIDADVLVQGWPTGELNIAHVRIERGTILCVGDDINGFGSIQIAEGTWIGQYNNIRTSHDAHIVIGKRCLISQYCSLVGANHGIARNKFIQDQPSADDRIGVVLGDDVWLGAGSVILPGVTVANGAVVGANSVVNRNVGEYEIWCGAPATKVGERP